MKRLLTFLVFSCVLLGVLGQSSAQSPQDYRINNFDANYAVSKQANGTAAMQVNEYIQAQFPDYDQNHGIVRALPLTYNSSDLKLKILAVNKMADSLSPTTSGWAYTTAKDNGNLVLKIGEANSYVRGTQNFHINYSVNNVARKYTGYDEIFWNVNGTQWQQPMQNVSANIIMPADIGATVTKEVCYTGAQGSTAQNCTITKTVASDDTVNVAVKANTPLQPSENLSFAIAFKSGTFAVTQPSFWHRYQPIIGGVIATCIVMAVLLFIIRQWRKYGRDPKGRGTIVAEYQPPKSSILLMQEFVLHESGRPVAITAQIINFAIRGYLRIIDTEKDKLIGSKHSFSLEKLKGFDDLTLEEQQVTSMLFSDDAVAGTIIELDSLKNKLAAQTKALWANIATGATAAGYFSTNPQNATRKYTRIAMVCLIIGLASFFFLHNVFGTLIAIALGISGIMLFIGARYMPARTLKGVELHDYLLGLKLYINTAEKERIAFHQGVDTAERQQIDTNDPAQKIKLFEQLLPYAMLFGLEKDWGKQFKDIYSSPPDWYGGSMNNFSTAYLLGGLSGLSNAATTSFSAPSSSGGSGFSGGFSGGGGGGGGGGGW